MNKLLKLLGKGLHFVTRARRRLRMYLLKPLFAKAGTNVIFDPDGFYSFSTIEIGDDVYIGLRPHFSGKQIVIGNKVMFGPSVHIHGGDHQFSVEGKYMFDLKDPGESHPVIIEDDVWIGAKAIILKGVRIGTGSIIGAGSVVTRDVDPYSVVVGNPARVIRDRFSAEALTRHIAQLRVRER